MRFIELLLQRRWLVACRVYLDPQHCAAGSDYVPAGTIGGGCPKGSPRAGPANGEIPQKALGEEPAPTIGMRVGIIDPKTPFLGVKMGVPYVP